MKAKLEGVSGEVVISDPNSINDLKWFAANVLDFYHIPTARKGRAWITQEQFEHWSQGR